ncbi:MAG: serine hydrolase [Patescibacteria group bacterium]
MINGIIFTIVVKRYLKLIIIIAVVLILILSASFIYFKKNNANNSSSNTKQSDQSDKDAEAKRKSEAREENINLAIKKVIVKYDNIDIAVSFEDIDNGDSTNILGDKLFIAASTVKIIVATDFLEQMQDGKYGMNMKMGNHDANYHLEQMVSQSNNDSWALFNNLLSFAGEEQYAKKIGITYVSSNNSIKPNDINAFLGKLYRGELLNKENTDLLLSLMRVTHDDRYLPGSAVKANYYHKTGKYEAYVHDVGIIDDGTHKYAISIFTDAQYKDYTIDGRIPIFHEIVEAAYAAANIN